MPVNQRFTADRISRVLTMTDFDIDGVERSMALDGGKMSKLLCWIVHTLEIFMWPEDYDLDPESLTGCFWDVQDEDFDEDFLEVEAPPVEPKRETSWQVRIEYADGTTQEILSYQSYLSDRPEELYLALLKYFEPEEDGFSENFDENAPLEQGYYSGA